MFGKIGKKSMCLSWALELDPPEAETPRTSDHRGGQDVGSKLSACGSSTWQNDLGKMTSLI